MMQSPLMEGFSKNIVYQGLGKNHKILLIEERALGDTYRHTEKESGR